MFPHPQSVRLLSAFATLQRGTAFLGNGLWMRADAGPLPIMRYGRHKVIGNGLRELDRFLNVLIDEIAVLMPARHVDAGLLARQRNTANKLRTLHSAMGRPSPDHERLRALGRSRDCLFYCDGIVSRGDERNGATMTVGWPSGADAAAVLRLGDRLAITPEDITWICRFYDRLATELLIVEEVISGPRLITEPF